jgi:hypothetical protein
MMLTLVRLGGLGNSGPGHDADGRVAVECTGLDPREAYLKQESKYGSWSRAIVARPPAGEGLHDVGEALGGFRAQLHDEKLAIRAQGFGAFLSALATWQKVAYR